jgi:uncharacterized protein (UPF0335 family)
MNIIDKLQQLEQENAKLAELVKELYNSLESVTFVDRHYKYIKIWDEVLNKAKAVIEKNEQNE